MKLNNQAPSHRSTVILGIVLALLQLSVVPNVGILGGRANLALVFVACACMGADTPKAPVIGFLAGLFYDLAGSGPVGLMALLLTVVAWLLSSTGRSSVAEDLPSALALFAPVALVVALVYAIVLLVSGQASSFVDAVFLRGLPGAVLDCVCLAVCGVVLSRVGTTRPGGGMSLGGRGHQGGHYKMKRGL